MTCSSQSNPTNDCPGNPRHARPKHPCSLHADMAQCIHRLEVSFHTLENYRERWQQP
jgi:hypothetical protein